MLHQGSRILGIDLGTKWVGLAIADWDVRIATGYDVKQYNGRADFLRQVKSIVEEERIELVVLGLPLNMDGSEGVKAIEARKIGELIKQSLNVDLEYMDERLTTFKAIGDLHQAGSKAGKHRRKLNMMAAITILQDYLDGLRA